MEAINKQNRKLTKISLKEIKWIFIQNQALDLKLSRKPWNQGNFLARSHRGGRKMMNQKVN